MRLCLLIHSLYSVSRTVLSIYTLDIFGCFITMILFLFVKLSELFETQNTPPKKTLGLVKLK